MTRIRQATARTSLGAALVLMSLCAVLVVTPLQAWGADTYTTQNDGCSSTGNWGGGQTDAQGTLYVPCDGYLRIVAPGGFSHTAQLIEGNGAEWALDVAPSPDGSALFASIQLAGNAQVPQRFVRDASGNYDYDPSWQAQPFTENGASHAARSRDLATDAWGNLYVSNGLWQWNGDPNDSDNATSWEPIVVVKYDPSGHELTQFGDSEPTAPLTSGAAWGNGMSVGNAGLAVAPDGKSVYFTDMTMGRVQRFALQSNGSYAWMQQWGDTVSDYPAGSCAAGKFGAPYDVGTDAWGFVYVLNTSCTQIQKFTADGSYLQSLSLDDGSGRRLLSHGFAVNQRGDVYTSPPTNRLLHRTSPDPSPLPTYVQPTIDTTGPVIDQLTAPASTTGAAVTLTLHASDPSGVPQIRIAVNGADISAAPWTAYAPTISETLAPGVTTFSVQARDGVGNVSAVQSVTITYTQPVAVIAGGPTIVKKPVVAAKPAPAPVVVLPLIPVLQRLSVPRSVRTTVIPITLAAVARAGVGGVRLGTPVGWTRWIPYTTRVNMSVSRSQLAVTMVHGKRTYHLRIRAQVRDRHGRLSTVRALNVTITPR